MFNYCKRQAKWGLLHRKVNFSWHKTRNFKKKFASYGKKKLKMRHKRNKETQTSVCLCLLISVATTGIEPVFHA